MKWQPSLRVGNTVTAEGQKNKRTNNRRVKYETKTHHAIYYQLLIVSLTDAMLDSIHSVETAKLYYYDSSTGKLVDMNAAFDLKNKTATFYTDHFSTYMIEDTSMKQNTGVSQNTGIKNPNTGHDSNDVFLLVILSGLCVFAIAFYKKAACRKKIQ